MISPPTVDEIRHQLGLSESAAPLLRAWWGDIERWEREQCAQVADAVVRVSERGGQLQHGWGARVVAAQIRRRR